MAKRDYLVEAAKQIRMALDREVNEDYEAAFSYYKNGVDLLLNGVQVDPNKERREAVKRKTTQYLKRAEEIFISHLQDNLGKGSEHLGGYSSLRFRPIRHLSSPVEDLEMCKVVGIIDKVLTVQSLINKEMFVVKSLPKSSWESRDQPTIIPQGVPFMVKLLRYYVSEDAVYLHLEHVQGGRLFSRLHQARSDRAKEHPECNTSGRNRIRLRNSHTSPSISTDYQRRAAWGPGPATMVTLLEGGGERDGRLDPVSLVSPASPTAPWDEAQQRLDSCGTHSYCEETGCLQNLRSAAPRAPVEPPPPPSAATSPLSPSSPTRSGTARTDVGSRIRPIPCQHSETQGNPDLPIQPFIGQALDAVASGLRPMESSSDFDVMWNAAKPERSGSAPYAAVGPPAPSGASVPQNTPRTSEVTECFTTTNADAPGSSRRGSSSPATLHLSLQSQSQVTLSANGCHLSSCASGREPGGALGAVATHTPQGRDVGAVTTTVHQGRDGRTAEEEEGSASTETTSSSGSAQRPGSRSVSLALTGVQYQARPGEEVEEAWELLSPGGLGPSANCFPLTLSGPYPPVPPGASPQCRRGDMDAFLKAEASEGPGEEEVMIEVEGWCHLPRAPRAAQQSSGGRRGRQGSWGLPEAEVRLLGAQILLALESLHQQGVLCRDLNPNNILLASNGKVCLTFFSQWSEVQSEISSQAMEQMYCAPEIGGVSKITEACDWWSLGALLFELLTETPLWQFHPAGVRSHTQLLIPDHLSTAAASLLTELLQFDAGYRLGSGGGGVSDIKCHPFFNGVPWQTLSS